jgi:hypothetical protein
MRRMTMKYFVIFFAIVQLYIFSGHGIGMDTQKNGGITKMHGYSNVVMRDDDDASDEFIQAKKEYYKNIIDFVNNKRDITIINGSDDNIEGLTRLLIQYTHDDRFFLRQCEIIPIIKNPNNNLYVAEFNYDGWQVELLLILYEKGKISLIKEVGKVCEKQTELVSLVGFDDILIQTYTATNTGNGYMKLITFNEKVQLIGIFKVVDYCFEFSPRPDINKSYNLNKNEATSYVYGEISDSDFGFLQPKYLDLNCDGYSDVLFVGVQTLYDNDKNILDKFDISLVYLYDPQNFYFNLSIQDSLMPSFWDDD